MGSSKTPFEIAHKIPAKRYTHPRDFTRHLAKKRMEAIEDEDIVSRTRDAALDYLWIEIEKFNSEGRWDHMQHNVHHFKMLKSEFKEVRESLSRFSRESEQLTIPGCLDVGVEE